MQVFALQSVSNHLRQYLTVDPVRDALEQLKAEVRRGKLFSLERIERSIEWTPTT